MSIPLASNQFLVSTGQPARRLLTQRLGDVGINYTVTLGAGSTLTGRSGFGLKVAGRKSTTAMLQVIGLSHVPDNAFGDANPKVEVRLVQHVDSYTSAAQS